MNHLKPNPVGIDYAISLIQKPLYKELEKLNAEVNGYGRVYKNKKEKGLILEAWNSIEYCDVLGGEDSRFFFYMHNELSGDTNVTAKVDVICMVRLTDFFSGDQRNDEEFRRVVAKALQKSKCKLKKTVIGMEYIERIAPGYQKTNAQFSDMHPYHVVTFQTEIYYNQKTT